ncbi:InlB B-repeat-containing protein, partial [Streptococcus dentiloxodontae]
MKKIGAGSVLLGLTILMALLTEQLTAAEDLTATQSSTEQTVVTEQIQSPVTAAEETELPALEANSSSTAQLSGIEESKTESPAAQTRTAIITYAVVYVDTSGNEIYRIQKTVSVETTDTTATASVTENAAEIGTAPELSNYQLNGETAVTQTVTENADNILTFTVTPKEATTAKTRSRRDVSETEESSASDDSNTASSSEEKEQAEAKSELEALIQQAQEELDKSVVTEKKDEELVTSYSDFREKLTEKIATVKSSLLGTDVVITTEDLKRAVSEVEALLTQYKDSVTALDQDYPTYHFYDQLKGENAFQTQVISSEDRALMEPATPTAPSGKVFVGWFYRNGNKAGQQVDFTEVISAAKISNYEVDIDAKYEDKVSVTYVSEGVVLKTIQLATGDEAPMQAVDVRAGGMIFKHWSLTPDGEAYDFSTPLASDITLYAVLQAKWELTFNTVGGSPVDMQLRDYDSPIDVANVSTTRAGYTFKYWSLTPDGEKVDDAKIIESDTVLYAVWEKNIDTPYTVLYYYQNANDDDYSLLDTVVMSGTTGEEATYEFTPSSRFVLKSAESKTIAGDGTTVVKLYIDRQTYTYTFYKEDGRTIISTGVARFEQDLTDIFRNVNAIAGNPEFAYWTVKRPSISYLTVTNGYNRTMWPEDTAFIQRTVNKNYQIYQYIIGEGVRNIITIGSNSDVRMDMGSYTISGYTQQYVGTGTNSEKNGISTNQSKYTLSYWNPTVYVYYTKNKYQFEVVPNKKGINEASKTYTIPYDDYISDYVDLNTGEYVVGKTSYTSDGITYVFTGWYESETGEGIPYSLDANSKMTGQNIRLYGGWEAQPLNVTVYHDADKTTSTVLKVYKENAVDADEVNSLLEIPDGYDKSLFKGWYTEVNGVLVEFDLSTLITSDVALVPVWNPLTRTISYDANGGIGTVPQEAEQILNSKYVILGGSELSNGDKQFIGWNTRADGKGTSYKPGQTISLKDDLVLYAQWNQPRPLSMTTGNKTMIEKRRTSSQRVVSANKTPYQVTADEFPEEVSGLQISNKGILSGTPRVSNWGDEEESRTFEVDVTVTSGSESVAGKVSLTILRDTDGDGIADNIDSDDDNDGIPDNEDANKKVWDALEVSTVTLDPIMDKSKANVASAITSNKPHTTKYSSFATNGAPTYGLFIDQAGNLTGTANVTDWTNEANDDTRTAQIEVTATSRYTNQDGSHEVITKVITVVIQRDTDGDGTPDVTDSDDDNDGILDSDDKHPKVADSSAPVISA